MIFNLKTNVTQAKNYNSKKKGKNKFRGLKKIPKRRVFFFCHHCHLLHKVIITNKTCNFKGQT